MHSYLFVWDFKKKKLKDSIFKGEISNWDHFPSRSPRPWLLQVVSEDRPIEDQRNAYKAGGLKYSYMQAWVALFKCSIESHRIQFF